jgi:hypothetical protein
VANWSGGVRPGGQGDAGGGEAVQPQHEGVVRRAEDDRAGQRGVAAVTAARVAGVVICTWYAGHAARLRFARGDAELHRRVVGRAGHPEQLLQVGQRGPGPAHRLGEFGVIHRQLAVAAEGDADGGQAVPAGCKPRHHRRDHRGQVVLQGDHVSLADEQPGRLRLGVVLRLVVDVVDHRVERVHEPLHRVRRPLRVGRHAQDDRGGRAGRFQVEGHAGDERRHLVGRAADGDGAGPGAEGHLGVGGGLHGGRRRVDARTGAAGQVVGEADRPGGAGLGGGEQQPVRVGRPVV